MAKKSMLERESKRVKLVEKYRERRTELKKLIKKSANDFHKVREYQEKLSKLPVNSNPVRHSTRCGLCGRSHAVLDKFNLCRICVRNLGMTGNIPGLRKSSW